MLGPAALAGFAAVPSAFAQAKSWVDVAVALLMVASIGFAAAHGKPAPAEPGDGQFVAAKRLSTRPPGGFDAPLSRLRGRRWLPAWAPACVVLWLLSAGCSRFARVDWGKVEACVAAPADSALVQIVSGVLAGTGNVESELEAIAVDYGAAAVKCAVEQLVADLGSSPVTARASRQLERGRAFLAKVRAQ